MWKQWNASRLDFGTPSDIKPVLFVSLFFFLSFSHCVSVSVCDRVCLRDCVKSHVVYTYMERMPNTSTTHKYQKVVMLISSNWIYIKMFRWERERKEERAIENQLACFATNQGTQWEPGCALSAYKAMPLKPTKLIYYVLASVFKWFTQFHLYNWLVCLKDFFILSISSI